MISASNGIFTSIITFTLMSPEGDGSSESAAHSGAIGNLGRMIPRLISSTRQDRRITYLHLRACACVCVFVCVCECVRAIVSVSVSVCVREKERQRERLCIFTCAALHV